MNMTESTRQYAIRPQARTVPDSALEGCFHVFLSSEAMAREGIRHGDWILMSKITPSADGSPAVPVTVPSGGLGIAWRFQDTNMKKDCIKIHDSLRSYYSFELKDKLTVSKYSGELRRIQKLTVRDVTEGGRPLVPVESREDLEHGAAVALFQLDAVACGLTFEAAPRIALRRGRKRRFLVDRILPASEYGEHETFVIPFYFDRHSSVEIRDAPIGSLEHHTPADHRPRPDFSGLFGLDHQINELRLSVADASQRRQEGNASSKLSAPGPVLIEGPPGSGKSTILSKLGNASWTHHNRIRRSLFSGSLEKVAKACAKTFADAKALEPSLIVIDDIEDIASAADHHKEPSELLAEQLRALSGTQVLVVATTRKFADINDRVQRCFHEILELPMLTEKARLEVTIELTGELTSGRPSAEILQMVAERTPAFIADDLKRLCKAAYKSAARRAKASFSASSGAPRDATGTKENPTTSAEKVEILRGDFEKALSEVHATVMTEAYVEVPRVRWTDIAGCEEVKRTLDDILGFPLRHPDLVMKWGLDPTMGILLYGPPGCSKTLTAQAVATEYGRNFISVKGAELVSKYVGESEYRIREIFRKARTAAPSVIFFDEIDAIARRRGEGHEGLHTVTTLLTEMDGVERSKGVLVLAATNKPEIIDEALLRPRRLGTKIYMGPPNIAAREQIIMTNTKGVRPADLDTHQLATMTDGYSGADIVELCGLAKQEAAKEDGLKAGVVSLRMEHFEAARRLIDKPLSAELVQRIKNWNVRGSVRETRGRSENSDQGTID